MCTPQLPPALNCFQKTQDLAPCPASSRCPINVCCVMSKALVSVPKTSGETEGSPKPGSWRAPPKLPPGGEPQRSAASVSTGPPRTTAEQRPGAPAPPVDTASTPSAQVTSAPSAPVASPPLPSRREAPTPRSHVLRTDLSVPPPAVSGRGLRAGKHAAWWGLGAPISPRRLGHP